MELPLKAVSPANFLTGSDSPVSAAPPNMIVTSCKPPPHPLGDYELYKYGIAGLVMHVRHAQHVGTGAEGGRCSVAKETT